MTLKPSGEISAAQFLDLADRVISQPAFRRQLRDDPRAALRNVLRPDFVVPPPAESADEWHGGLMR